MASVRYTGTQLFKDAAIITLAGYERAIGRIEQAECDAGVTVTLEKVMTKPLTMVRVLPPLTPARPRLPLRSVPISDTWHSMCHWLLILTA